MLIPEFYFSYPPISRLSKKFGLCLPLGVISIVACITGIYFVASAYESLRANRLTPQMQHFNLIRQWESPWKLITNVVTNQWSQIRPWIPICPKGSNSAETSLHVFRNWIFLRSLWKNPWLINCSSLPVLYINLNWVTHNIAACTSY